MILFNILNLDNYKFRLNYTYVYNKDNLVNFYFTYF